MEFRNARAHSSLWLAFSISLLLHSAALFIGFSASDQAASLGTTSSTAHATPPRLLATLAGPPARPAPVRPAAPRPAGRSAAASASAIRKPTSRSPVEQRSAPKGAWAKPSWSAAERADMNNFLSELAVQAKPPSGRELAQKALTMARQMRTLPSDGDDGPASASANADAIDPYSLAMYFDAFVRKMNRSAAFVSSSPARRTGAHKALVEIALNADGSLKSYRVLRSGDQLAEIAYIKTVIDRAAPFSAFPRDIRKASDSLSIQICILPAHDGEGAGFSRMLGAHDCRD